MPVPEKFNPTAQHPPSTNYLPLTQVPHHSGLSVVADEGASPLLNKEGDIYENAPTYATLKGASALEKQKKLRPKDDQPVGCCCGLFSGKQKKEKKKKKRPMIEERPSDVSLVSGIYT